MRIDLFKGAVIGVTIVVMRVIFFHIYYVGQRHWEITLRHSDKLWQWWLFSALLFLVAYLMFVLFVYLTIRRWPTLNQRSLLIDWFMAVMLLCLGTILRDPLHRRLIYSIGIKLLATYCVLLRICLVRDWNHTYKAE